MLGHVILITSGSHLKAVFCFMLRYSTVGYSIYLLKETVNVVVDKRFKRLKASVTSSTFCHLPKSIRAEACVNKFVTT